MCNKALRQIYLHTISEKNKYSSNFFLNLYLLLAHRTIIMNSKKFSNATFEEISHIVKEMVSLVETCCAEGADPNCYDEGVGLYKYCHNL